MKEDDFNSLIEILKILEKEDKKKSSIASAIVRLIEYENKDMTEDQKSFVSRSFSHYDRKRHDEDFTKAFMASSGRDSF
jgi:16S rRNA C1402 N4-methylase RsmH